MLYKQFLDFYNEKMAKNSLWEHWFTEEILTSNLHDPETLSYLNHETAIQRKINYILEKIDDNVTSPKDRLDIIKSALNIQDETAIQHKINYTLEKIGDKVLSPKDRLEIIKSALNIQDESAIKEIMWKNYRNKYFWTLEIESLNDTNKKKTIHILERSPEDIAEIKRLRAERKAEKHERKERWKRKWVQTTIKFPKDKE